ncbi:MAG: folylpolyglutamate synthase/dihydrofolate synthase family protein [Terrimicrobiaceae bacterium]
MSVSPAVLPEEASELSWLYSTQMFGIKLGLENITRLLSELGNPHGSVPCIHVAGTNGKGSVCAMLDAILRESGLTVGLYTSPHLMHFSERIRVQGCPIPETDLNAGLKKLRLLTSSWDHSPTFFEYATALAMDWFAGRCDVAVIETGMGGRLDATNVVDPLVSVITPIALDHMQWLGSSHAQIAAEKAGIFKPGRPAVSAAQRPDVCEVLNNAASACGIPLAFVDSPWEGPLALEGLHQKQNAALAVSALAASGLVVTPQAIQAGLASVRWPGRFQKWGDRWIFDGAHNPHSAEALVATWKTEFGSLRVPVIFGCLADKDVPSLLTHMESIASTFHFVPVANERTISVDQLVALSRIPSQPHDSPRQAMKALSHHTGPVLIAGSLFLVGEVLSLLQTTPVSTTT